MQIQQQRVALCCVSLDATRRDTPPTSSITPISLSLALPLPVTAASARGAQRTHVTLKLMGITFNAVLCGIFGMQKSLGN